MTRAASAKNDVSEQARHRVVIVGCGFGGLVEARALRRPDVDVLVIHRNNHHLFQRLLYPMAAGILAQGAIPPPIRDILRHQPNATVLLGEVQGIDLQRPAPHRRHTGSAQRGSLRQPHRGHGGEPVVLGPPEVRAP